MLEGSWSLKIYEIECGGLEAIMALRQHLVGIKVAKTHLQPIFRLHEVKYL